MRTITKHKQVPKEEAKVSEKKDTSRRYERLKNSALKEYYMLGGY